MKKLLAIIVIATLLGSCAAEKRLAILLAKHPELQRVDTTIIHDTIIKDKEVNTTKITLSELLAMDSIAKANRDSVGKTADQSQPTVSAATGRSHAALKANGDKTFDLESTAPPDTIIRTDTIYQPHYITEYKDREIEVYKQTWWQELLTSIGSIALVVLIIYTITIAITKRFKI